MGPSCKFDACENDVKYPTLGVCATCYSGLRLWVGRSPAQRQHRAKQYTRMQERMDYLTDGRGLMPGYRKKQAAEKAAREQKLVSSARKNARSYSQSLRSK